MKFRVGDYVRITGSISGGHGFTVGHIGEVTRVNYPVDFYLVDDWAVDESEIEAATSAEHREYHLSRL